MNGRPLGGAAWLFFELFSELPRQGPGDDASTLKALGMVPHVGAGSSILDLGCGTGRQTLLLAQHTAAQIVAVDNHAPYLAELERSARHLGFSDRIDARHADMRQLALAAGSFDLVWCEGAFAEGESWLIQMLADARARRGPTLFDMIVELMRQKGHAVDLYG